MLLSEIALASTDVAATSSRLAKIERLAACLAQAAPDEVAIAVAYLSGVLPQGTVGVGWAALRDLPAPAGLAHARAARGRCGDHAPRRRSPARARRQLGEASSRRCSLARPSPSSASSAGLFLGELRQGALEGVMTDAVAKAADVPASAVRRAAMLAGDLSDGRGGRHARGRRGSGALPADAAAADHADAGSDRRGRDRRAREAGSSRTSNGSSTARASRRTVWATTCVCSPATSPTSPSACRRSSLRFARWTSRRSCSTARRSRSVTTADRSRSR